ncbi:MAG TPA: serine hydrolase, partial [Candidatus Sulfotelmatobacter sp.]|nr:serine hydrolase [Candidatus Sulfotelmatobacter sp.]
MKQIVRLRWFLVLIALLLAWQPMAQAATKKPAKSTKSSAAPAAPVRKGVISRNPYLGAIVVDAATGKVLFEDQADAKGYPASVLKLMDLLIILEKIEQGQLKLTDQVPVSAKSAKTGGSQVWLAEKESFTLDEMLYAL